LIYRWLVRPFLWLLPAETAHHLAFRALRTAMRVPGLGGLLGTGARAGDPALRVRALGLDFPNPLGLAAGFDKNALGYDALASLGFGFVEVGTVTGHGQAGNPQPRMFRLPADLALLNRLGFNNEGADVVAPRLVGPRRTPVGVNIGKTKTVPDELAIQDYVRGAERLGPLADYLVVNVSSPNTPGLRDLQSVERLRPLLKAVRDALDHASPARPVPLLVKIAPDLADADVDAVADLALELGLDGIIATNTTVSREGLSTDAARVARLGAGGISGAPLKARSLAVLGRLRARVGDRLVLVSAGGIASADDAWERIRAGATLLQLYTALIYQGPSLPRKLLAGLAERARSEGFASVQDAVGSGTRAPSREALGHHTNAPPVEAPARQNTRGG
jgi:dihydroorotate dehydrogenase